MRFLRIGLLLGLALLALSISAATRRLLAYATSPYPLSPTPPFRHAAVDAAEVGELRPPVELVLRKGETLGRMLQELGLDAAESHAAAAAFALRADPRRLQPGDRYRALYAGDGVAAVDVRLAGRGHVQLVRRAQGWDAAFRPSERRAVERRVRGELRDSLESSIRDAGADSTLAFKMAEVLQWDLDFNRDLRSGDRFEVLYEDVYLDGEHHGLGEVLALTYHNGGRLLEAYRYGDRGYYDAAGRPLRKMFLRSPLPYSRITSRFSTRRFHPVLKSYRPHYGIDYGAPVGTAARVTAGGVVVSAGWDGGGGKTVKVRHPNGYLTAYLHLSRYAEGIRAGARVAQGDVIGYVGSTGLSTAPHLDYRVQHRGRWIDPLQLANVPAPTIPDSELASFRSWRDAMRVRLSDSPLPGDTLLARQGADRDAPAGLTEAPAARR